MGYLKWKHNSRLLFDLTLMKMDKYFKLEPSYIGDPEIYLGAKLNYTRVANSVWCWTLSPSKYVQ